MKEEEALRPPQAEEAGNERPNNSKTSSPIIEKDLEYINLSVSESQQHYERCEKVILSYCKEQGAFRALIGDHNHWWNIDRVKGTAKLFYPNNQDYDALTSKYRTLYWTAQLFATETANIEKPYDFKKHRINEQIGGREDTVYHSFFLDLDKAKDKDINDTGVIEWLEKAIKFFGDTLLNAGVKSFGLAFSGGGVYCVLHPRLGMITKDEKERVYKIEIIQKAFDLFIGDVASKFFKKYSEAIEWVKFDKLNYDSKRQVKTILSIHKKYSYAVIPLDTYNPKIDLKEASLPISDETIEKAKNWLIYQDDINSFGNMLSPFLDKAKETIKKTHGTRAVTLETEEVPEEDWAPCIRNIIAKKDLKSGEGASRALSVLASYMRYVGVPEEKAHRIFQRKADEWNAETSNIFESWYGCEHLDKPQCFVPSCEKVRTKGSGYPHPELGELRVCVPDERCKQIKSPVQYHEKKKKRWGGKEVVEIALKFGDIDFGVAKIRRGYEGGVLVRVDSEKYAVAERTAPTNFYQRNWYVNTIFKKIKKELGEDFDKFWDEIEGEIEDKIEALPEIEKNEEEGDNVEHLTKGELEDGRYFEEIMIDGVETFAVYDNKNDAHEFLSEINNGGKIIYPRGVGEEEKNSLMLADGVEEYGSLAELRKEMVDFALSEFDPVDNKDLFELVVYLALTTWIAPEIMENLIEKFCPIVSARGASETGKKRFLTVMRWLTYRSMYVLKTVKVPTLFRMVAPWGATLILDEADLSDSHENADFVEFMNARADGVSIPRYNASTGELDFFKSFGMTVLAERSAAVDDGFESRKIIYPSDATTKPEDYSLIPPEDWCVKGKELLRKLLLFKFRHMKNTLPTNLIIPNVNSFRVRESLLLLQSLSNEDEEIEGIIGRIAKKLEERIIIERANSMDGLIINTVYGAIVDEDGYVTAHGENCEITREHRGREGEGEYSTPITLKTISGTLGDALSPSEVARRWRGLGQGTREQAKIDGKRFRGIVQIQNIKMFKKHLKKYVVDVDWEAVGAVLKKQNKQGRIGEAEE